MNLLIDIGNSSIKYQEGAHDKVKSCPHEDFLNNLDQIISKEIVCVFICSVGPKYIEEQLVEFLRNRSISYKIIKVKSSYLGLTIDSDYQKSIGADRWVLMLACWQRLKRSYIVIDFGTTITLDFVDGNGKHNGGMIFPGEFLLRDAIFRNTQINKIENLEYKFYSGLNLSKSTRDALRYLPSQMILPSINHATNAIRESHPEVEIYLSGKVDVSALAAFGDQYNYVPNLIFDGLSLIADCGLN